MPKRLSQDAVIEHLEKIVLWAIQQKPRVSEKRRRIQLLAKLIAETETLVPKE